jgi:hypothetical protein
MPALYPSMVAPESFRVGEAVRKFISDKSVTPFLGTVTQVVPSTYKVWVQWPTAHVQESPEDLIKVNPAVCGMPTALQDMGYDSYEKNVSERSQGMIPGRTDVAIKPPVVVPMSAMPMNLISRPMLASEKMALRVAHTFATTVVDKLVEAIVVAKEQGLSDIQTYNRTYDKFSSICSDHIIRSSIQRIYDEKAA